MAVVVIDSLFDPWQAIQAHQEANGLTTSGTIGAASIFVGTMRDFNDGSEVTSMVLEHYPGMTEKQLASIVADAGQQWQIIDTLLIHRVGEIKPKEPIVLVAVWSSHRGDAFDATRHIMEALKSKAPFWKKERLMSAEERWVLTNSNGYKAG